MHAQFLRERHNVLAALQSLHRLPAELVRITSHSFLCHLQFLSLHSVPFPSVSFLGSVHRYAQELCSNLARGIICSCNSSRSLSVLGAFDGVLAASPASMRAK